MLAITDDQYLYLLEFIDSPKLEHKIKQLIKQHRAIVIFKSSIIHQSVQHELNLYFSGRLNNFTVPIFQIGSDFQMKVWGSLTRIPLGKTYSYMELAKIINKKNAYRAVANANGSNKIAIIVPCHRIITSNNKLGGYSGGVKNKQFLLTHEYQIVEFKN